MDATMRICRAVLLLLALLPVRARAQEKESTLPEVVQELFEAETVYPQGAGEVQLTADGGFADAATARLAVEYGITDQLQVSAATPYLQLEEGGEEEWTVGALYNLVNRPTVAASVALDAVITTDGRDSGVEWEPALIVAGAVGMAQLHGSVAATLSGEPTELTPALGLMLDAGRITPTLELRSTLARGETPEVALTPGIFVHLSQHLEAGVGAPVNLHGAVLPDALFVVTLEF